MSRPSFDEVYLELARLMSRRSTCLRLQVGCCIVSADMRQVLAVGYNGNAAGLPNTCDLVGEAAVGNCGDLHAEENACISCCAPRSLDKVVYSTDSPCLMCAKRLVNLGGVRRVRWLRTYRNTAGVDLLLSCGIDAQEGK